jgi:arginyl-tRNA--protein-N-Asp/Glu arginylyltransferase
MSEDIFKPSGYLAFYRTLPHECGYLPNRQAINAVVDPALPLTTELYSRLAELGFRRSGARLYRPACPACCACIALRIPVADFHPNRSQRRVWRCNSDVVVRERPAVFSDEHFALYRRYLKSRHPFGGMDDPSPEDYLSFLSCAGLETKFHELSLHGRCIAVAVSDVLANGFSAVYTFFDPEYSSRSPGVYAILWQIETVRRLRLEWLYLGYWIEECRKMSYKNRYYPHELFMGGRWHRFDRP